MSIEQNTNTSPDKTGCKSHGFSMEDFFQKDHTQVSDDKNERKQNWDKHTKPRPGGEEKKKDESRGWFRRKPAKKKPNVVKSS